jgi:succinyl-diaminopimelate desuccinylase
MTLPLLKQLLARPSISPGDAGCVEILKNTLEQAGFTTKILESNQILSLYASHGAQPEPNLCLSGHVDVVPPGPIEAWHSDPFAPTEQEGYLYARGAADMKSGVAAMTVAAINYVTHNPNHPGTISLLFTSDEEGTSENGTIAHLPVIPKPTACLVGEPTSITRLGDEFKIGRRGSISGKLTILGKQGHTAYAHLADNAIHKCKELLVDLLSIDWGSPTPFFPPTDLQISNFHAGDGIGNVIPGQAKIWFNVRNNPQNPHDQIQSTIESIFAKHNLTHQIEWSSNAAAFLTENSQLTEALRQAIHQVTGIATKPSAGGGTSDARIFASRQIPVIEFGPINATIHAANESIFLADIEPLTHIYNLFIRNYLHSQSD